jgi:DNA-binding transcriptional ArsR family regulator
VDDEDAAEITKALSHPLRFAYLRALKVAGELSPSEFARDSDEPLGNASYHVKKLFEAGVIEVASLVPKRGAMEHRYSFTGPRAEVTRKMMALLAGS